MVCPFHADCPKCGASRRARRERPYHPRSAHRSVHLRKERGRHNGIAALRCENRWLGGMAEGANVKVDLGTGRWVLASKVDYELIRKRTSPTRARSRDRFCRSDGRHQPLGFPFGDALDGSKRSQDFSKRSGAALSVEQWTRYAPNSKVLKNGSAAFAENPRPPREVVPSRRSRQYVPMSISKKNAVCAEYAAARSQRERGDRWPGIG